MIRSLLFVSCLSAPLTLATGAWAQDTERTVGDALTQPLRDLSLLRREPAEVLQRAAIEPYADPPTLSNGSLDCARVASEIELLNAALGQDVDVASPAATLMAQAGAGAGRAVVDAVGDLVELPYRSVIRRLTGAERRDREMRAAVQAGMVRRAFLKGLGARECASPQFLTVIEPTQDAVALAASESPLSDLELARMQLAAANASAFSGSAPMPMSDGRTGADTAVAAPREDALYELQLARRQLAAARAAAVEGSALAAWPVASQATPEDTSATETLLTDLALARRQLAAANLAAQAAQPPPVDSSFESQAAPAGAPEDPLAELERARAQLAAAQAAAMTSAAQAPPAEQPATAQ